MLKIRAEIFREYDIRGEANELNDRTVYAIGRAFGTIVLRNSGQEVVVGKDDRESSDRIMNAFCKGVLESGCNVISIGLVPIPALYFSIIHLKADGGAMITGSHLEKNFNGLKLSASKDALTMYGEQIRQIKDMVIGEDFEHGKGNLEKADVLENYIENILKRIKISQPIDVVVDCGNGCSSLVAEEVFEGAGCKAKFLFCKSDGSFPNHHPDPVEAENLRHLIKEVRRIKADIGLAFDGDADRIGSVDEKGNIIAGDYLLALFAKDLLDRKKGAKVVFEVKCSEALPEIIRKNGGIPIMYKTGHSLIKKKMVDENALLAGEMSGHMFFRENYFGFDDAIYASLKLCEIVCSSSKSLSEMISEFPRYYITPEIRLSCEELKKWKIVEDMKDYFDKEYEVISIDGARVILEDGWFLVRASNTSAKLIVRAEAKSEKKLAEITKMLYKKLIYFGVDEKEAEKILENTRKI
ncbi:MAG: phosphomannomutase/phosphoglucomutase [Candidatus Diapherotrites archaeon]|nr:phosphomannomutase/phosphoglucomutase [Candidatus Diapherotrites archaeon]